MFDIPHRTALCLRGFSYKPLTEGIDAWRAAQVIHPAVAAAIRQTSFERSFHEQQRSGESAEARAARVVSEHLKEDHMGSAAQLEHTPATAVQRSLVQTTYPLLPPKITHHTAKLCFRCEFCTARHSPREPLGSNQLPRAGQPLPPELLSHTTGPVPRTGSAQEPSSCSSSTGCS